MYRYVTLSNIPTYIKQINALEANTRTAITKRYPILLPYILGTKRLLRSAKYRFNPYYGVKRKNQTTGFNLVEHSSPLFRKFNKRELDEGKITNINIAIRNLDGVTIPPGKVFSFWKAVGKPTSQRGFQKGLVLSGGELKEDIGGGLCQLSNLIAYMFAATECAFIERKHHSRDVFPDSNRAVPFASGATVFYNLIDLKVKNTYPFPITLHLRTSATQLRGSISAPVQLDYSIQVAETDPAFIKTNTKKVYRCNKIQRIYLKKHTKERLQQKPLWTNIAEVMYDEQHIKKDIISI